MLELRSRQADNLSVDKPPTGRVASLHLHPSKGGAPMAATQLFTAVAAKGIAENKRYFGRVNYGRPSKRQVTLIEREVMQQHADALQHPGFEPGEVRSNIETVGIELIPLVGRIVQVGEAHLEFVEARTPCSKMDALAPGLRALMENERQGVIARVVRDGAIRPGDAITPLPV